MVGVAAVVAQQSQALIGEDQQQVGVTIVVEIGRQHGLDGADFFEADVPGGFAEFAVAEVAPEAEAGSGGEDVQPAIVVVVEQRETADRPLAQRNRFPSQA